MHQERQSGNTAGQELLGNQNPFNANCAKNAARKNQQQVQ